MYAVPNSTPKLGKSTPQKSRTGNQLT